MTYILDDKIQLDDSFALTAFSRLRTANARLLGEYRYMYPGSTETEMNDKLVGAGTLTADFARNCFLATVGTASGDTVIRQTKQYHSYIAGTSNIACATFTFAPKKANLVQECGLYDDLNGIFFRVNGLTPEVVIRKNGVDTEVIAQSAWNADRLDGSLTEFNPSGITLDTAKNQIVVVDYQWLGVGRVRIGFDIGGVITYVHYFNHANITTEVYMYQASLPIRWAIYNSGPTASSSQLMIICGAVYCEGADTETGFSKTTSTGNTGVAVTAANSAEGRGILAVRLKNSVDGKPNRVLDRIKSWSLYTNNDVRYNVVILPSSSFINGSPTWTPVAGYSWSEYTTNFALTTGWKATNTYNVIADDFGLGAQGNNRTQAAANIDNRSSAIYQNYDSTDSQIFALIAYRLTTDASINATMSWAEIK